MRITVSSSSQTVAIDSERGGRMVLLILSLLRQIDAIDNGQLRISWGLPPSLKWTIEIHGHDDEGLPTG